MQGGISLTRPQFGSGPRSTHQEQEIENNGSQLFSQGSSHLNPPVSCALVRRACCEPGVRAAEADVSEHVGACVELSEILINRADISGLHSYILV
ncbi:hypothetical protein ILYODFUR_030546 [Ilyodon furcidens]|uniref:Uncharacterized protein n=1 Tax=Ilyodon furcidens TaxID=33524 RepID=A0ABV0TCF0_9TELE